MKMKEIGFAIALLTTGIGSVTWLYSVFMTKAEGAQIEKKVEELGDIKKEQKEIIDILKRIENK
jgi:hypothetical protein